MHRLRAVHEKASKWRNRNESKMRELEKDLLDDDGAKVRSQLGDLKSGVGARLFVQNVEREINLYENDE